MSRHSAGKHEALSALGERRISDERVYCERAAGGAWNLLWEEFPGNMPTADGQSVSTASYGREPTHITIDGITYDPCQAMTECLIRDEMVKLP